MRDQLAASYVIPYFAHEVGAQEPINSPVASRTPRQAADAVHGGINENCLVETRIKNRPASLKIPQDSKAGTGRREMLERMSAQDESNRIDRMIVEFEQFGECIKRRGDKPVRRAGISCRKRNE